MEEFTSVLPHIIDIKILFYTTTINVRPDNGPVKVYNMYEFDFLKILL